MIIVKLDQKSEGWLRWRSCGIGASDAPIIHFGKHFRRTIKDLWTEKRQHFLDGQLGKSKKEDAKSVGAMARGTRLEPKARGLYEQWTGYKAQPLCGVHSTHQWMKASLDGWIPEAGVVVEIKAPNREDHQCCLDGGVPEKYQPQLDHLMAVSDARFCHYCSYSDYFQGLDQFNIVLWPRDEKRLDELMAKEAMFWDCVQSGDPSDLSGLVKWTCPA